ncbi:beta-lactamase family protein [Hymenobacter sp. 5317J-9]|uniref:serine hydrolase n=1 Tax=Hymenobacter sp. 5317J-9 TaxID=2932250 RepID=UPI001FD6A35A|nr:serine hydrolase [Hymenobacter sp. 5317J-9]UOQ97332.1 beta-lactamase family protein [Hymenobacter sp. 5317J-9]
MQLPAVGQLRSSTAAATTPAQLAAAVQRIGNAFIQQPSRVGLSVGIIKDGRTQFYNFGTTEKGKSLTPTKNTVYEIGSISKTFGSLLLAKAVMEKRAKLTDDVRKYLPGTYANLEFAGQPIQLLHLANTTSGLPDNLPDHPASYQRARPDSIPFLMVESLKGYTKENFLADLRQVKLEAAPGLTSRHSNTAAQLLGYVLENVYKRPFPKLVAEYINKPLQLNAATEAPLPVGYNEHGTPMPRTSAATMYASGGLQYSAADMTKYLQYQLNENDAAVALTHRPTWGRLDEEAVGLSWVMSKTVDSKRQLEHTGGTFGFASYCAVYPELKFGIVLLSNESDPGTQSSLRAVAEEVLAAAYGTPPALAALQAKLLRRNFAQAPEAVAAVKKQHPELHLTEDYLNTWGYALVQQGQPKQALEIFKLNVSMYPKSWNVYDSLGETYELLGDRTLAIKNYKQSLALNPNNNGAAEYLKKTGSAAK